MKPTNFLKPTPRGHHAVSAMLSLARNCEESGAPVSLSTIARSSHISMSYLEQMFKGLRQKNLVRSLRGPGGGYVLARPADTITIADILQAAESANTGRGIIRKSFPCDSETEALWNHIGLLLKKHLQSLSLEQVLRGGPFSLKSIETTRETAL